MMRQLIAESGGTKTDWCLIENGTLRNRFETPSLHPIVLSDQLIASVISRVIIEVGELANVSLKFYGAGCLKDDSKTKLLRLLAPFNLQSVEVHSDLEIAGRIFWQKDPIWVAIMGTGSVLFRYGESGIQELIGGKGYLEGDEGSGYYFGKLLLEKYKTAELTIPQMEVLNSKSDVSKLLRLLSEGNGKYEIAALSTLLSENFEEFHSIHEENWEAFYLKHLYGREISSLFLVGGYADHFKKELFHFFNVKGIDIIDVVKRPLDRLIEQSVLNGD